MLRFILLSLITLLLTSCFDNDNSDTTKVDDFEYHSFKVDTIKSSSGVITSETDTHTVAFNIKSNYSYEIEVSIDGTKYYPAPSILVYSDGSTFSTKVQNTFKAKADTTLLLKTYGETHNPNSQNIKITIHEYSPTSEQFNGMWVLARWDFSAFGTINTYHFNADSAYFARQIKDDRMIHHNYKFIQDIHIDTASLIFGYFTEQKYRFSNDSLFLLRSDDEGYELMVYKRFNSTIDNISWFQDKYKPPHEIIGTWYLSNSKYQWLEVDNNLVEEEDSIEHSYEVENTHTFIDITSDTIFTYSRNHEGNFEKEATIPHASSLPFFNKIELGNECFIDTFLFTEVEPNGFSAEYDIKTYTKYDGPIPPEEWK